MPIIMLLRGIIQGKKLVVPIQPPFFSKSFNYSSLSTSAAAAKQPTSEKVKELDTNNSCSAASDYLGSDEFLVQLKEQLKASPLLSQSETPSSASRYVRNLMKYRISDGFSLASTEEVKLQHSRLNKRYKKLSQLLDEYDLDGGSDWKQIRLVYDSLKETNIPAKILDRVINLMLACGEDREWLRQLILDKERMGHQLKVSDGLIFITQTIELGDYEGMSQYLDNWICRKHPVNLTLFNEALRGFLLGEDLANAQALFSALPSYNLSPNVASYIHITELYLKRGNFAKAQALFHELTTIENKIQLTGLNYLLGCFAKFEDWNGCRIIVMWSLRHLPPNLVTLNILLQSSLTHFRYSRSNQKVLPETQRHQLHLVNTIYAGLHSAQVKLDKPAYNGFLRWYLLLDEINIGYRVLRDMAGHGITPDLWEYGMLMRAHSNRKEWARVLALYNTIQHKNLPLNDLVYATLVKALLQLRGSDPHKYRFDLSQGTLVPNINTYNIGISLFTRRGLFNDGFELYNQLIQVGFSPNRFTLVHFFEPICHLGWRLSSTQKKVLKNILPLLGRSPQIMNLVLYNMIINSYSYLGEIELAHEIYDEMIGAGYQPNSDTFSPLVRGTISQLSIPSMAINIHNDKLVYYGYIDALVTARQTDRAIRLRDFIKLSKPHMTLDIQSQLRLIHGCLLEIDLETAIQLVTGLHQEIDLLSTSQFEYLASHLAHLKSHPLFGKLRDAVLRLDGDALQDEDDFSDSELDLFQKQEKRIWLGNFDGYLMFRDLGWEYYQKMVTNTSPNPTRETSDI